ncbi:hypothetical protein D3C74_318480 [compost metagenome]
MRDNNYRCSSVPTRVLQQTQHLSSSVVIKRPCRLIAKKQLRLLGERPGNRNTLLFSTGKLCRKIVQALPKSYTFEHLFRIQRMGRNLRSQLYVFLGRQIRN